MAEEHNTGLARAPEPLTETDSTKEELQRRMEEARESITQTVAEIKETVTNQYQQVRETISDSLDWREQYRRRPVAFSVGAMGAGLLIGYGVAGALKGSGGGDDDRDYLDEDYDEDLRASVRASSYGAPQQVDHAYAASVNPSAASPAVLRSSPRRDVGPDSSQAYGIPVVAQASAFASEQSEPAGPGLIQRVRESGVIGKFKETKAYDRLQQELGALGDRFVEEISTTARNVVLPALLGKVKDLIGIDLSTQREVAQRSRLEHEAASAKASAEAVSPPPNTEAPAAAGQPGGGAR